jgi:hypothetical protein
MTPPATRPPVPQEAVDAAMQARLDRWSLNPVSDLDREYLRRDVTLALEAAAPVLAASPASGILTAAAETLRYVATWGSREPADLAEVAAGIEQMRDAPPGSLDWTCCPLCQEITCDHGCPLRTVRGQP